MTSTLQALRAGWRHVAKAPGSSFLAVLALALGLGLTTAAFSLLDAVFLRGLPLEGAERLVRLERLDRKTAERSPAILRDFLDWRRRAPALEELAAFRGVSLNLSGEGVLAERANGAFVSDNLFRAVGARAFLGRTLAPGDGAAAAPPVTVLGYALWRDRFGGERAAIGRTVRVDGEMRTIVGVMPEGFGFPLRQEIWIPLSIEAAAGTPGETMPLQIFGKVRQGVSLEQARARLGTVVSSPARESTAAGSSAIAATPYVEAYTEALRPSLRILFAAAVGVLCIACLNVANLLLGRFVARRGDLAVQKALGRRRVPLVVEQQAEALLLGALGALAGLAVAKAGVALYLWAAGGELPSYWMEVRFDARVLLFAASVAMVAALLCGTLPALRAAALDPAVLLKDASRSLASLARGRLTRLLVVAQVALSVALLVATGLAVQSFHRLGTLDLGFSPAGILAAQISLPGSDYASPEAQVRFYGEAARRIEGMGGVSEVAWTSTVPGGRAGSVPFRIEGAPVAGEPPRTAAAIVSPRFFAVLGRSLLAGRDFAATDTHDAPAVAIVNASFARRYFPPGTEPLGRRIQWGQPDSGAPWMTVVGVAPDLLIGPVEEWPGSPVPALYAPLSQNAGDWTSLLVRTEGDPLRLAPRLRQTIAQVDSRLPLFWIDPLTKRVAQSTETHRALATLISVLGLTALVLAALGIYGVMALAVGQRAPEFGLRLALGAVRREILELVLYRAGGQVALGLLLGLPLAIVLCRRLATSLYGVRPLDPPSFLAAAAVIAMAGIVASLVPALRAARSDPAATLRR